MRVPLGWRRILADRISSSRHAHPDPRTGRRYDAGWVADEREGDGWRTDPAGDSGACRCTGSKCRFK